MQGQGLQKRFEAANVIVREAGALVRKLLAGRVAGTFKLKGNQDYFTEADGEVERLIAKRLSEAFPGDKFLGEEEGGTYGERTWVVDPIDGTANFARGIPHYSISMGYIEEGRPAIGVVYNPAVDELFAARQGGGAFLNGRPIRVSAIDDLRSATVELGWSTRRPMTDYVSMVGRVTATGAGFLRCGSGALGMAYVAAGRIDGYAELHINAWDTLAGIVLVEEAGGWTNDFLANDGLHRGNPILGCTPALRNALVAATGIGVKDASRLGCPGAK